MTDTLNASLIPHTLSSGQGGGQAGGQEEEGGWLQVQWCGEGMVVVWCGVVWGVAQGAALGNQHGVTQ